MTEHYKLTYFNARAAAEPIRYILALAGVEYEDNRVDKANWPAMKPTTRWGQLPYIEVNGEQIAQSLAIGRYLARKYKLAGETPMEEFRADELIDAFGDLRPHMRAIFFEQDEAKKAELRKSFMENHARPFFTKLTALKEKNGGKWMVGQNVTWADIHIAHGLDWIKRLIPSFVDEFPAMTALQENVFALPQIKKWIETRPQTDM